MNPSLAMVEEGRTQATSREVKDTGRLGTRRERMPALHGGLAVVPLPGRTASNRRNRRVAKAHEEREGL